jgi:hypothetical protein
VTTWDRTNRIEMDLALARGRVAKLEDELIAMGLDLARVTSERDLARRVAMRLEEENHLLAMDTVLVPVWGEAT